MISKEFIGVLVLWLTCGDALARALEEDWHLIDQEERLGSEYHSDLTAYRPPLHLSDFYDDHDLGYLGAWGSLSVNEASFDEKVKLGVNEDGRLSFQFQQRRQEEFIEQRISQRSRLAMVPVEGGPFVGFYVEGQHHKKWADLGLGIGWRKDRRQQLEFVYWAVDHYYNAKEETTGDEYARQPWTLAANGRWDTGGLDIRGRWEFDHPLRYHSNSSGYSYESYRHESHWEVRYPIDESQRFDLLADYDLKSEAKEIRSALTEMKSLRRRTAGLEGRFVQQESRRRYATYGLRGFFREADYAYEGVTDPDVETFEPRGKDALRREVLFYSFHHRPVGGSQLQDHRFGPILALNQVDEATKDREQNIEAKFQYAWQCRLGTNGFFALVSNWEIDEIFSHFPYKKERYLPWDGGGAQIVAAF